MAKAKGEKNQKKRAKTRDVTEQAFLDAYDPSAFDRPSVAVDVALLSVVGGALFTLLHQRSEHPFKGRWSLPGGFVRLDEPLDAAARRLLADKGKLSGVFLEQLMTFGDPRRDPRMRVISVAYYALVDRRRFEQVAEDESELAFARIEVPWEGETGGPIEVRLGRDDAAPLDLAFDHADILGMAVKRI